MLSIDFQIFRQKHEGMNMAMDVRTTVFEWCVTKYIKMFHTNGTVIVTSKANSKIREYRPKRNGFTRPLCPV